MIYLRISNIFCAISSQNYNIIAVPQPESDLNLLLLIFHLSCSQKISRVCYPAAVVLICGHKGLSHIVPLTYK